MKSEYDFVVVVSNNLSFDDRMIRTCKSLSAAGYRTLFLGRDYKLDKTQEEENSFDCHRVKCLINRGPLFYFELIIRFKIFLRKISYAKLLCVDLDTALLIRLVNRKDREFILDLHEYFEEVPELQNSLIRKKIWSFIGNWTVKKFDFVYTVNTTLARIFQKKYARRVEVIRNIPSEVNFENKVHSIPLQTVYHGVLNPGRGLEILIEIIANRKDVHLTIIGDGPLRANLMNKAQEFSNIEFSGMLHWPEAREVFRKMHIGWNLLDPVSFNYQYSLANKVFQYLLSGIPVVTMSFPEYKALIDHHGCGLSINDYSKESIENILNKLVEDVETWTKLHLQCKDLGKTYNWKLEQKKLLDILIS